MKKLSRIISALLVIAMILAMLPAVFAAEDKVNFAFLVTSDIHGKIFATDYSQPQEKSGTYKAGLTRTATYIKRVREEYGDNLYLADIGDTIQGEPLTYYYAFNKKDEMNPAMRAFRYLNYDLWVVGNHEFNYGLEILNHQLDDAVKPADENGKPMNICMANYLKAETNNKETKDWATWRDYAPYYIKDFNGVKVAIIGFGNPNIPKWDIPANWEGIYFADIIETYKHYEAEMKEKSDMIVVMAHSGVEGDDGSDFMKQLVEETDSIDFVFSGHQHGRNIFNVENKAGVKVPILQPGTKCKNIAQVEVSYDKTTKEATVAPKVLDMTKDPADKSKMLDPDPELVKLIQPCEDAVWNDYMMIKIGEAAEDYPAADLGTKPSAFMDLINTVQLWGAYDNTGLNTPEDKTDDKPAQLSISAPLTSGDNANIIDKGNIYLGDMFKLYRFENWFYQITMTGEEVHQWLEFAATKIQNKDGKPFVDSHDLTYYDVIYGDGFHYDIDYTKPAGERVVRMTYNNKKVAPNQEFTVVVNNYRYNGGGNYVKWLNEHGCEFKPNDPDRVIYSTQFDMIQGEDNGQARTLLTNYIKENKTITPKVTSDWTVSGEDMIVIYYTNDIHCKLDSKNMSYEKVAAMKQETATWADGVMLLDAGDHIQGTPFGGMDKGETIIKLMNSAGYDASAYGNHEFDYGMDRTLALNKEAEFPYLSCNFRTIDGKTVADPYKIFDVGGKKIAIIGVTTPESITKSTPAYFQNEKGEWIYKIDGGEDGKELYKSVQDTIDAVKKENPDYIIALGHLGIDPNSSPWTSKEVIANVSGLDAFIDGHSHSTVPGELVKDKEGKDVVLTQTGASFKNVGAMTIRDGKITTKLISSYPDADEATKKISDDWKTAVDEMLGEKIAESKVNFAYSEKNGEFAPKDDKEGTRIVRSKESNLGDFVTDALLYYFKNNEANKVEDIDFAIMNGGGIRDDLLVGDVTYKTCKEVHTFGNMATVIELTGQQVLDALEWGARDVGKGENGGFLQVSGLTYEINTSIENTVQSVDKIWTGRPTGQYRVTNVKIGGKPLDLAKTYKMAGYNYTLMQCGDGFNMFKGCKVVKDSVQEDYLILAEYAKAFPKNDKGVPVIDVKNSPLGTDYSSIYGEGRIKLSAVKVYDDVKPENWFYKYVMELSKKGIVNGATETSFLPEDHLTRGQIAVMLYRIAGEPEVISHSTFIDVPEDEYYSKAVAWAQDMGYVYGRTASTYVPEGNVTREELATIFYRIEEAGETEANFDKFEDGDKVQSWAILPVKWAVAKNIIGGTTYDGGKTLYINPQGLATRAEASKIFIVWMELHVVE